MSATRGDDRTDPTIRIAVDAMGGDHGVETTCAACAAALTEDQTLSIALTGDAAQIRGVETLRTAMDACAGRIDIVEADGVVPMGAGASAALRAGRGSSMWRALDLVASGDAAAAVSAGDTAALTALSTVRLRPAEPIKRPAIAALWPSTGPYGANIVLDVGATVAAEAETLVDFAVMGAEYARVALGCAEPRVALLNVGSEEAKGRADVRAAARRLAAAAGDGVFNAAFVGYVEADEIAGDRADVVVADGFSGNVALKSAEGAARLIGRFLRETFEADLMSKAGAALAGPALRRLKRRMDPRRVNGGVFLGLTGAVVKSHGAADAVGFRSAVALAADVARSGAALRIADAAARIRADADHGVADGSTGS